MDRVKRLIKAGFSVVGLDVSIARTPKTVEYVSRQKVDLLLDVGANAGQYALAARKAGFANTIVSFEPLPDCHASLIELARGDPKWIIHERCALGAFIGAAEINIAKNSYSSSLLPMLPAHQEAAPESTYAARASTKVVTLDSIFGAYYREGASVFLKIDTQGFESQVLGGAQYCLPLIGAVQLELSVLPLYESQELYDYFFDLFRANGFMLWSIIPGFTEPRTGQMLQFDAIFVRPNGATLALTPALGRPTAVTD